MNDSTTDQLLARYHDLGFRLVYWKRVGLDPKGWKGPRDAEWNSPEKAYPLEGFDPTSMNVGVMTGHEVAPGRFLADVDLDWAEGLSLAAKILPSTGFGFGRKGKKLSHAFFTTPTRLELITYDDITDDGEGNGERFVELRSGDSTSQTMVAPSLHSPNTRIELVLDGAILHVESAVLQRAVLDYAIGCLLLKRVTSGLHHDGRKALAGFLLRASVSPERVTLIGEEVCRAQASRGVPEMSSKDVADMATVVRSTVKRVEAGKKVEGGPSLAEFIGGPLGKSVLARLNRWLGREDDFIRNNEEQIVAKNQENIKRAIAMLGHELSYNEFSDKMLVDGKPMEDREVNNILTRIEIEYHFQPPEAYFERVIKFLAWAKPFHPVKDYLATLSWDGMPRIDRWLITAAQAEDTPYVRAVSAIMLIAAVRRIREPGCKYDEMVIWESPQGGLKSSAARALCARAEWFSDDLPLNVSSQKIIEATLGKWVVEASDLAGKRKTEIEQLKAMLSRGTDGPARMAYAHFPVERPRHFILIGTTNSPVYLPDPSGGRRFWPMVVSTFDIPWIVANRDQLWAEASVREAAGESNRLPEALWPAAGEEQEQRREIDPWEPLIRAALLRVAPSGDGRRRVVAEVIWHSLGILIEHRDRMASLRISDIMHRFGFKRTRIRPPGEEVQVGFVQEREGLALGEVPEELVGRPKSPEEDVPF